MDNAVATKFEADDIVHVKQVPLDRNMKVIQVPNIGPRATMQHMLVESLETSTGMDGSEYRAQYWVHVDKCRLVQRAAALQAPAHPAAYNNRSVCAHSVEWTSTCMQCRPMRFKD